MEQEYFVPTVGLLSPPIRGRRDSVTYLTERCRAASHQPSSTRAYQFGLLRLNYRQDAFVVAITGIAAEMRLIRGMHDIARIGESGHPVSSKTGRSIQLKLR